KQPGICWFSALAGRGFGMDEQGAHLLELLWMLSLGVVTWAMSRRWLGAGPAACVPLAVCGFYYAVAGSWQLLQVEGLVGLPLALSLAAADRASLAGDAGGPAWLAAGAAGGVALVFKLVLAPVLAAIWALPVAEHAARAAAGRARRALAALALLALGALLPLGAVVAVLARQGALARAWWSW